MRAVERLKERAGRIDAPVLVQELRVRQRGVKPFVVTLAYTLVLAVIAFGYILLETDFGAARGVEMPDMARIGRELFEVLSFAQVFMLILVVPAYSAGAVAVERERQTFDLLAMTLLSSTAIIRQKLVAAVAQSALLVLCSVPITAMVFMLGGVSPLELVLVYLLLLVTAAFLGGIGVLCSCLFKNARSATFCAYLATIGYFIVVPVCFGWVDSVGRYGFANAFSDAPLMFTLMFSFTGGVMAFVAFGALSLLLRKARLWFERAFRMAVFGVAYAVLLLVLSTPVLFDALLHTQHEIMELVNPLDSLDVYLEYSGISSRSWTAPVLTSLVCAGAAYLLERFSTARFNLLRRA